ncbi:hypothetical protein KRX52_04380 [Pseudomonas sp. MAP12]|uniref:Uncharacterized protein n=1 Tax=Geopseudomonas aromaticivorans TaxID=2849492 RepID=A0ABS6MT90_9GAMM|nr:hypothetical protein [Pseudomonas aromaticivorans]MBV2132033.1 hypothetical protein [Pseudomonas aromaticivorans]
MREVQMIGLGRKSLGELEQLQVELRKEWDGWRAKSKKASGQVFIKGAGRRSMQVRSRLIPSRRNPKVLAEADAAITTILRYLRYIEDELARRAAGEAARA